MTKVLALVTGLLVAFMPLSGGSSARPRLKPPPPVVIAVVENSGMNVLHSDYLAGSTDRLRLPAEMPPSREVELPSEGSFQERIEQLRSGPLGDLKPGTLYRIKGTRIIGIYISPQSDGRDLTQDRFHVTGVTSSAVGLDHGTNPDALLVYVADTGRAEWEWLEKQHWIDIISTSYYGFSFSGDIRGTCTAGPSIRRIAEQGRLAFSAIGNGEQAGVAFTPSGVPESYQVGGVDDQGRSYRPSVNGELGPTRPYETGDRFLFPAADADSLDGSMGFGGTSGATPSTAGRAAELISFARTLLGSDVGFFDGALATLGSGGRPPRRGPLKDGRLTRDELIDVMHHTATPAEPPAPIRYLVEGYGAFQEEAVVLAKKVLAGKVPEPERPEEDALHAIVDDARSLFFPETRCG